MINKYIISILLLLFLINNINAESNNIEEADYLKCDPKFCLKVKCGPNEKPCNKNSCCKGCKPDCNLVKCFKVCTDDETPVIDDCSCCPSDCIKNCTGIECPLIRCAPGYISRKVGCCNECIKDCNGIQCGEVPTTKKGDCCPSCPQ